MLNGVFVLNTYTGGCSNSFVLIVIIGSASGSSNIGAIYIYILYNVIVKCTISS
jgi:hypothetical protein